MDPRAIHPYRAAEDEEACLRIWTESGWIEAAKNVAAFRCFVASSRSVVVGLAGSAECLVNVHAGRLRHLETEMPIACVTGVATSRVARRQGLAACATAEALAAEAAAGVPVAALGVFEQGFYNRLGFGNGPYEMWCAFDPAQISIRDEARTPSRLTPNDAAAVHRGRLGRRRWHGAIMLLPEDTTRADMMWSKDGFGLGYFDRGGDLTHHIWCTAEKGRGPLSVEWMAFRSREEFRELLALLRDLGDQFHSLTLHEPPGLQIQDILRQPFKGRRVTESSPHAQKMRASAYWQLRILDLRAALGLTHLNTPCLTFNLELDDPIPTYLRSDAPWRGIGGSYIVTFGSECRAERGCHSSLPTLRASVNAFSRLWLGVRTATALSFTDDLSGPAALLAALDVLPLPAPASDGDF